MSQLQPRDVEQLRQRLAAADAECATLRKELFAAGAQASLPGSFVLLETAGQQACILAELVVEIVPLVALVPLAGAPPHVLGTFSYRGRPTLALDMAVLVGGAPRELPLDAHVLVLAAARPIALLVDRVVGLLKAQVSMLADSQPSGWRASELVDGFCQNKQELVPVLRITALEQGAGVSP